MNFFSQLIESGIKDVAIEIKVAEDGRVTVLTSPKSIAKDKGLNSMKPLLLTGTAEELDSGFLEAIISPLKKTSAFFTNVEEFEQKLEKSKKETAEAKAEKDKEKNAQDALNKIAVKLKTPADWNKNRESVKTAIDSLLEINSENSLAKKIKKDLDVNIAKAQMGGGLFADNVNEESVEEIPTAEIVDDEEEEVYEHEEEEDYEED